MQATPLRELKSEPSGQIVVSKILTLERVVPLGGCFSQLSARLPPILPDYGLGFAHPVGGLSHDGVNSTPSFSDFVNCPVKN